MELIFRRRHKTARTADHFFNLKTGKNYNVLGIGKVCSGQLIHCLADEQYHEIEQYTGVKDKKGQMIFKGDIVKFTDSLKFTILWDEERCGFYGIDDNGVDYFIICLIQMMKEHNVGEVIGHIHKEE